MYGEIVNDVFSERMLRPVMNEHTWFAVRQDTKETPTVCGFFQVNREQKWWLNWEGLSYDNLPLADLEIDEALIDVQVRFDDRSCVVRRQTQQKGVIYLHTAIVTLTGSVINKPRTQKVLLHGSIYGGNKMLQATDSGLVQENVSSGTEKPFAITQGYVEEGDTLYTYKSGILVVKTNKVLYLTLN